MDTEGYGNLEDLNKQLLYKRIIDWNKDLLVLEDGTEVTIEMSENDCCAYAGGTFSKVKLDAVITNVEIGDVVTTKEYGCTENAVKVTLYHNQNAIAQADVTADDGNGGFYYSIGSFVIKGIHYKIVEA